MLNYQELIDKAYTGFNNREIDIVLSVMHPDIHWPKAFEGGYVTGYEAVREYWTRQWNEIDPKVVPVLVTQRLDGKIEVEAEQLVKDLDGHILFDGKVTHIYIIDEGLLQQMDIK